MKTTACPKCNGKGRRPAPIGGYFPNPSRTCDMCNGSGQVETK
jgi:DnaJ-class molecular chaperone